MSTALNERCEAYFNEVKEGLAYEPERQKQVLADLKEGVGEFIVENPDATIDDIYESFGAPEVIISDNSSKVPVAEVVKSKRIKKWIVSGILAVIAIVAVVMVASFIDGYKSNRGHLERGKAYEVTGTVPANVAKTDVGGILF